MELKKISTEGSTTTTTSRDRVEVERSEFIQSGKGLLARQDFLKHEEVFTVNGRRVSYRTLRTLQLTDDTHIDPVDENGQPQPGYYLNHSCGPNAYSLVVKDAATGDLILVIYALKQIARGDEITVDYSFMESEIANSCVCKCGSSKCRGKIIGFKDLSDDEIQNFLNKDIPLSHHLYKIYQENKMKSVNLATD